MKKCRMNDFDKCDNPPYETITTSSDYCEKHLIQSLTNLTNEDIEWLLEPLDPNIDDGHCQTIIDKLEAMKL